MHVRRGCLNRRFKVCATLGAMTFSVRLTCQGGVVTAVTANEVPDGELSISGHADGAQRSLSAHQMDAAGRLVMVASATSYREA